MADSATSSRIVRHLSTRYFTVGDDLVTGDPVRLVKTASRGEEIDVDPKEEKRLDSLGALLPKGAKSEDAAAEQQALLDAYRGERGDTEAMQRAVARAQSQSPALHDGGIVNIDANVEGRSSGQLAEWMKENGPSVEDTVALAEGNPAKAKKVLEAEGVATGQSPRKGVVDRLNKIIEG